MRELPAEFQSAELPRGVDHGAGLLPGLPGRGRARRTRTSRAPASGWPTHPAFGEWPLVVLSDEPDRAAASVMNFLWTTFTRFEPAADIHAAATRVVRHHLSYAAPIVIDARMKPSYPRS